MAFAAPKRKRFSTDLKMMLFASQEWQCNVCRCGLPPTAEIDHYIPLGCGLWKHIPLDPNSKRNLQALCPNCHAKKTMKERLITPRGSYLPCACGRTHSTYFKPSCTYWNKKIKRIQDGVRRVRRKSKRAVEA